MSTKPTYLEYANDDEHMRQFRDHESVYLTKMRESDRVLVELLRTRLPGNGSESTLLDIGCAHGNLLHHLRSLFPGLTLVGADLSTSIIGENRDNPGLAGIEFVAADMLKFPQERKYDVITSNAALMFFTPPEFDRALQNLSGVLKPGGSLLIFDWFHPFEQELEIRETSAAHPRGLTLYCRSFSSVRRAVQQAGLSELELRPFSMPFDLARSTEATSIDTHTVQTTQGQRLSFRGVLHQPWCHAVATKKLSS
jgi:cyclopropane fatty-acyl-phospholipid synthase-like methyltransferase